MDELELKSCGHNLAQLVCRRRHCTEVKLRPVAVIHIVLKALSRYIDRNIRYVHAGEYLVTLHLRRSDLVGSDGLDSPTSGKSIVLNIHRIIVTIASLESDHRERKLRQTGASEERRPSDLTHVDGKRQMLGIEAHRKCAHPDTLDALFYHD